MKRAAVCWQQFSGGDQDLVPFDYDYYAPISSYGERRAYYHRMRHLHLMAKQLGARLTQWPARLPADQPTSAGDATTLRWSVRAASTADGHVSGLLFVTNHVRSVRMPTHAGVRFELRCPNGTQYLPPPDMPAVNIPSGLFHAFPVNLRPLPHSASIVFSTAQLVTSANHVAGYGRVHVLMTSAETCTAVDCGR